MYPHHQRAIDRLIERFQADPNYLALIIGGSIAKGWAKEDSDVDFVLIATEAEYARRVPKAEYHYYAIDLCDYPGGYVDGKIVDVAFLREVAGRGSEPARAAFEKSIVAYSRLPDLDDLLERVTAYPEAGRVEKIRSFYAQLQALQWYVGEAEKRHDRYLLTHVVADLILFGGRLILAHNRVLYPYHKWFMRTLQETSDKPAELMTLLDRLLTEPNKVNADQFCNCVLTFTAWSTPPEGWPSRFMQDAEWAWRDGRAPLADW